MGEDHNPPWGRILKNIRDCIVFVLVVGWVAPLLLSIYTLLSWAQAEVEPSIHGTEQVVNSFPFLPFAWSCFEVAAGWFFAAAAGVFFYLFFRRHPDPQPTEGDGAA